MTNPVPLMLSIQSNMATIEEMLGIEAGKFEEQYHQLVEQAQNDPDRAEEIWKQLYTMIHEYPEVVQLLQQTTPGLLDSPDKESLSITDGPLEPTTSVSYVPVGEQMNFVSSVQVERSEVHRHLNQMRENTQPTTSETMPPPTRVPSVHTNEASMDHIPQNTRRLKQRQWTPDLVIQLFKEIVTAVMGLLLVGYTLYVANSVLALAGESKKLPDAKDLLLLMLGLAGVVIGYYFGRIPADARTAQAQKQATEAIVKTELVGAKAETIANALDEAITDVMVTRGETNTIDTQSLQRLRDQMRDLVTIVRMH